MRKEGSALIDFFCEDKDAFKLDECFRIFQDFCMKFKKAVKVRFFVDTFSRLSMGVSDARWNSNHVLEIIGD